MPRARPRPVTRLREKTETSVTVDTIHRAKNDPRIVPPATRKGRPAATIDPKTKSRISAVMGIAIDSARARSPVMVSVKALPTTSLPKA